MMEKRCSCGSGFPRMECLDARGIFLCFACVKCKPEKLSSFRQDILVDPNYWTDEDVEES